MGQAVCFISATGLMAALVERVSGSLDSGLAVPLRRCCSHQAESQNT